MPNAVNRFKTNQFIKVQKDNENKIIKNRREKLTPKEKCVGWPRTETVWDRLSKSKPCPGQRQMDVVEDLPRNLQVVYANSYQKFPPPNRQQIPSGSGMAVHSNYHAGKRFVSSDRDKKKLKYPRGLFVPDEEPESVVYLRKPSKTVKQIMIPRGVQNSKSSSDESKGLGVGGGENFKRGFSPMRPRNLRNLSEEKYQGGFDSDRDNEDSSLDEYEMAPLMPVPTMEALHRGSSITTHFKDLLKKKKNTMNAEEIQMIKDVVKTDERHRQLGKSDAKLFKEILKTQLQEIIRQESVVKSALSKIDSQDQMIPVIAAEKSEESAEQKQEVDVIFKNVPTLEKEIIILKALGEKLEASLASNASPDSVSEKCDPEGSSMIIIVRCQVVHFAYGNLCHALVAALLYGHRQCLGIVREYRIAHKTINQLKEESHRHFYLPVAEDKSKMKRTSFQKLKANPEVLMRHLKAKGNGTQFNFLEQDPIFFNSCLTRSNYKKPAKDREISSSNEDISEDDSEEMYLREGGDSTIASPKRIRDFQSKGTVKFEEFDGHSARDEAIRTSVPASHRDSMRTVTDYWGLGQMSRPLSMLSLCYPDLQIKLPPSSSPLPTTRRQSANNRIQSNHMVYGPQDIQSDDIYQSVQKSPKKIKATVAIQANLPPTVDIRKPSNRVEKKWSASGTRPNQEPSLTSIQRRSGRRHPSHRTITPMPIDTDINPKTKLIKTILVGTVQITVFLILIMAITYPELKC